MEDVMPSTAAARAADALLRKAGGRSVLLRIPSPATPGDSNEQLGLTTPSFQDVELAPVVFRKAAPTVSVDKGTQWTLLVSASAVKALVGALTFTSASVLFANAFGVLIDDTLMEIEDAAASEVFGAPYVYRLILRAPLALNA